MRTRRIDAAAAWRAISARGGAWLYLALATLLLPRAFLLGEVLFERDLHALWYPQAHGVAQAFRQGLMPLWNPALAFGEPSIADPAVQLVYPTTWLLALLPPGTVYSLFVLAHLVFSAVGFGRLARASGLRPREALFAGAAWMLAGPFVSLVNLWHHFASAAWMPWVVLAAHRLLRRPRAAAAGRLGAALGMQVLAGSADMVLLTAAVSAAWGTGVLRSGARRRLGAVALSGAGGVLIALALSAGQWLPAVDAASRAMRRELPAAFSDRWSVPPAGLVRLALPLDASGRVRYTPEAQRALFDDTRREPFLASLYLGIVPLSLAAAVLAQRPRFRLACLAAGGVVATLVALGPHAGVASLVRELVPGVSHLRYPSKAMVAPAFACALLAAHGLAAARRSPVARRLAGRAALAGALVLGAAAALFGPGAARLVSWGVLLEREGVAADALASAVRFGALALVALVAAAWLLGAARRPGPVPVGGLVTLCLVGELWLAHHDLHPTAPAAALLAPPPVLSALDRSERGRVYVFDYALVEGVSAARLGRADPYPIAQPPAGFDPRLLGAVSQRLYPVPPVAASWDVEGSYDIDLTGLQPLALWGLNVSMRYAEGGPAHTNLLRLGAVSTVVALDGRGFEALSPGPSFPSLFPEPVRTFRVPGALPRARLVGRARWLEGREALAALFDPAFDPVAAVILSGPGAAEAAERATGGAGRVVVEELRVERVRLRVEADGPAVVVLADAWDPGWRAWVDGRRAPVLRANVAFRGVAVPAGRHVVELRYRPRPALLGLLLTGASALGLAAAFATRVARWRRRRLLD